MLQITQIYTELCPLTQVRISFSLNILIKNEWMEFNKILHTMHFDIDKIWVGIVLHYFGKFITTVMAHGSCQKFVSTQYLKNKLMLFDQILHKCLNIDKI